MIVAAAGHRPRKLGGYGPSAVQDRVRAAIESFFESVGTHTCECGGTSYIASASGVCPTCREVRGGTVTYTQEAISGMALGVDQWFAETCIVLGIPFTAAVPCDDQERLWPEESQRHYRELLAKAHYVRVVSPGPYAPWKMQARNEFMVNECDVLLAVWDGSSGGTASQVRREGRQAGVADRPEEVGGEMSVRENKVVCDGDGCSDEENVDLGVANLVALGWSSEGDERFCPTCTTAREARCVHCGCKARTGYHEPTCPIRMKGEAILGVVNDLVNETKPKHLADAQLLIAEECDAIKAMLLEKNTNYGSSFSDPLRIFSKASMDEQINVRLDDKLSRLARGAAAGEDVELDLMGYLVLKRVLRKMGSR